MVGTTQAAIIIKMVSYYVIKLSKCSIKQARITVFKFLEVRGWQYETWLRQKKIQDSNQLPPEAISLQQTRIKTTSDLRKFHNLKLPRTIMCHTRLICYIGSRLHQSLISALTRWSCKQKTCYRSKESPLQSLLLQPCQFLQEQQMNRVDPKPLKT